MANGERKSSALRANGLLDRRLWLIEDGGNGIQLRPIEGDGGPEPSTWLGPGLVDLQVNGVHGVDFNDPNLSVEGLVHAAEYLRRRGVVQFYPTVITNTIEITEQLLRTIAEACSRLPHLRRVIPGIHLEGPFISPEDGARGAHPRDCVCAPDVELFKRFQRAANGAIRLVTLAPEWETAIDFIRSCQDWSVVVALGHTLANSSRIHQAVEAGARLSTHLGNGVPLMLPRHPNVIWDQLGEPDLWASFIADGHHLPESFLRAGLAAKGHNALLVSDATAFAGCKPGRYTAHIGGDVELLSDGRLCMAEDARFLAGAAQTLDQNVALLCAKGILPFAEAWALASTSPRRLMDLAPPPPEEWLLYEMAGSELEVREVAKLL